MLQFAVLINGGDFLLFDPCGGGHSGLYSPSYTSDHSVKLWSVSGDPYAAIETASVFTDMPTGDGACGRSEDVFTVFTTVSARGLGSVWFIVTDTTALEAAGFYRSHHGFPLVSCSEDGSMSVCGMAKGTRAFATIDGLDLHQLSKARLRCFAFVDDTFSGYMPTVGEMSSFVTSLAAHTH